MPATITHAALCRSLSRERLDGYSAPADCDPLDAIARYLWNLALCAAFAPTLHLVEIAFRNALYSAGVDTTANRFRKTGAVACWLDAVPTLLRPVEERDVAEAIHRLGSRRRHTPGHLVGQLGFGFWVRLCQRPYEQGKAAGPQLWPAALKRFPGLPRARRHRQEVATAAAVVRDLRNRVAHHQPIWDRAPVDEHRRALELLGWLNPTLAKVTEESSQVEPVYGSGPAAYQDLARRLVTLS